MKRLFVIALAAVLSCGGALAQMGSFFPGPGTAHSSATYAGPGDFYTGAAVWVGLRAFSAADKGNRLINLCDNAGNNCADITSNSSTGLLNSPGTLGANDCTTSGTCKVKIIYDRSGALACSSGVACDMTHATLSVQPVLVWNSGNPYLQFSSASSQRLCSSVSFTPNQSQPLTVSWVGLRSSGTGYQETLALNGATVESGWNNSANSLLMYAGGIPTISGFPDVNWYAVQSVYNQASSTYYVNSVGPTTVGSSVGTSAFGGVPVCIGGAAGAGLNFMNGFWREAGMFAGAQSSGNQASINAQQRSVWGF